MNKLLLTAAFAATAIAAPAFAQPLPAPVVAVVNIDQLFGTCTVCAAANTQIQAQAAQLQARAQQLSTQVETEGRALQTLVNALPAGQQPDAALAARITTFETLQRNSQTEVANRREQIQRNIQFVRQQIGERARPAIATVSQQRGATLVLDRGSVIDASAALDITPAVLAIVNQNTTPLNVTAPAQATPAATPATTPATTPARPRPQGR